MSDLDLVWLAAEYHFPSVYSCRIPLSSMSVTQALPGPCYSTVRLALVKIGIELFGIEYVKTNLFQIIRAAQICVMPPEQVALTSQLTWAFKSDDKGKSNQSVVRSIACREFAHSIGVMTVFVQVPAYQEDNFRQILQTIGYWGKSDSIAVCLGITRREPVEGEFVMPLGKVDVEKRLYGYWVCLGSDFRDANVAWEEILPTANNRASRAIKSEVYIWPMVISEQSSSNRILLRRSMKGGAKAP